jgi:hypothetical protein
MCLAGPARDRRSTPSPWSLARIVPWFDEVSQRLPRYRESPGAVPGMALPELGARFDRGHPPGRVDRGRWRGPVVPGHRGNREPRGHVGCRGIRALPEGHGDFATCPLPARGFPAGTSTYRVRRSGNPQALGGWPTVHGRPEEERIIRARRTPSGPTARPRKLGTPTRGPLAHVLLRPGEVRPVAPSSAWVIPALSESTATG